MRHSEDGAPTLPHATSRSRVSAALTGLTGVLIVLAVVAGWLSRTALDTDAFVERVVPVVAQPAVRAAISAELAAQLTGVLDLPARVEPILPSRLSFLAAPVGSALDDVIRRHVVTFVDSPAFRNAWERAVTVSHRGVVVALTGTSPNVSVVDGMVVVNLIGVVAAVLSQLPASVQRVIAPGRTVAALVAGAAGVSRAGVGTYLGVTLPDDFAQVPVMRSAGLEKARAAVRTLERGTLALAGLAIVAGALTIWTSSRRRRTVVQLGVATAVAAGVLYLAIRQFARAGIAGIADPVIRPAAAATLDVVAGSLRTRANVVFWLAVLAAVLAYLAGPGMGAVKIRSSTGSARRFLTDRPGTSTESGSTGGRVAGYLDAIRLVGTLTVALILLIWGDTWAALVWAGVALALFHITVTFLVRER